MELYDVVHRFKTVGGKEITYTNPNPANNREVNGVRIEPYDSMCCALIKRGDLSTVCKPGIWQATLSNHVFRVHFTCPWCGKINTLDDFGCSPECIICRSCVRHYFIMLADWSGRCCEEIRSIRHEGGRP